MSRGLPKITPVGVAVACAAVAFAVLGWSLGYTTLTIVAAALGAATAVCWLATLAVPGVEVTRVVEPVRVARGQPALGLVSVSNDGRRRTPACTAVDLVGGGEIAVRIPPLAAGRSSSVHYQLPTQRRGTLAIGPLAIVRRDPFGLWEARRRVGDTLTLLVHPRIHPIDPRPVGRARHLEGPVSDTAPRGTLTFHTLREYVPGDDIRRVHWRSTARTGTLMVREHVDTSLPSTVLVLDTRASRYSADRFEEAVDVAASVLVSSLDRAFPVRLVTTDGAAHVVRAGQRGQRARDYLATVQPGERGDMRRAALEVLRGRDHDALIVVGGEASTDDLATVTSMARGFATAAVVTLRSGEGRGSMWTAGIHLDGETAAAALARWKAPSTRAGGGRR
jgi:uncharacterized protein (DUF58 family)